MKTGLLVALFAASALVAGSAGGVAELEGAEAVEETITNTLGEGAGEVDMEKENPEPPAPAAPPGETTPPQAAIPEAAPEPPPPGRVARSAFATAVVEREPQDALDTLANDASRVYFFTELRNAQGQTVTHRWTYNGQVVAEVPIRVGAPRWRAYSIKHLEPGWLGEWTVSVVDEWGRTLATDTFDYVPSPSTREEPSPAAAEAAPGQAGAPGQMPAAAAPAEPMQAPTPEPAGP